MLLPRACPRLVLLFLVFTAVLLLPCPAAQAKKSSDLPLVVVVTTGGTIAEENNPKTGGAVPEVSGASLVRSVPDLAGLARIKVVQLCDIDSSQMTPAIWLKLSAKVDEILADSEVKGVVVTHGTDTMACGAYFLNVTLSSDKPVVFTGAMRDPSDMSPDGPLNIYNAIKQVTLQEKGRWGVTLTMNQFVADAYDVRKFDTTNVQCFTSGPAGYLGHIGTGGLSVYRVATKAKKLKRPESVPLVPIITQFPGDDGSLLRQAVDLGYKGIVIEGVGAGNVNAKVYQAVKYALGKGLPVVLATQVYYGGVRPIYGDAGGGLTLEKEGVIMGGRLTAAKASLLLGLALANHKSKAELVELFQ